VKFFASKAAEPSARTKEEKKFALISELKISGAKLADKKPREQREQ